jgi:hypothetical protein
MDELSCQYVGSHGLLKLATHRAPVPSSDFGGLDPDWYANLHAGAILHVCTQALPAFVQNVLPTLSVRFKLLTNNSDATLPDDYQAEVNTLLASPLLIHWFSQNWVGQHEKVSRIPIGLDYHTMRPTKVPPQNQPKWMPVAPEMNKYGWGVNKHPVHQEQDLLALRSSAVPFWDREVKAYANFQFVMWTRYGKDDRKRALEIVPKQLVYYQPLKTTRDVCWSNMVKYAFVVSPQGNGLDCHRTWEALCLGCIPIVKTSGLDSLFDGLPVWSVRDWSEVSQATMRAKVDEFRGRTFQYEKLTLAYWKSKIVAIE